MTTGDRLIGRGVALVGLAFGAAYVGWRIVATLAGAPVWLAVVTLLVEIVGFVAVTSLVWALWRSPEVRSPRRAPADMPLDVDVLIRCSGQDTESLRATLLASQQLGSVYVLDLGARPEIAALALEADAVYIATDSEDLDGLGQSLHALAAPTVLMLEAGDVPRPDIVDRLAPWLDEPDVAVVQGRAVSVQNDSAEHDAGGRHDKDFERRALVPSLGARGMGAYTGSGALIRRSALIGLPIGHATRPMVQAEITLGLMRQGWRIAAPGGDPVVAVASQTQPDVVESMHACEASGALHLLGGPDGALRINSLSVRQRLALLAMASRPLAGVRRSVVILILLASLLSGSLPFTPSVFGLVALWAPWFGLSSLGLWVLSDGSLRPGDRLRSSMRLLGASWRGVMAPNGRPEDPQYAVAGAFGVHHGVASAAAVAAISVVVGLRGVSDRLTHTLQPLPIDQTAGLLVVVLWSLGGGLDALRLLARRAQTRRATRVASSLPSTFADRAALVVDLTPHGAGVISEAELAIGAHDELNLVLPTATGVVSATVPIMVRNARADFSGERRYGVEFGSVPTYVADALAEYCVVQPAVELMGGAVADVGQADARPVVVPDDRAMLPRRIGLRVAALVAVAGAMASSVPTSVQAAADSSSVFNGRVVVASEVIDEAAIAAPLVAPADTLVGTVASVDGQQAQFSSDQLATDVSVDIVVVDSIAAVAEPAVPGGGGPEGALVTVLCAVDDGADDLWGTSDDVFNGPVSAVVDADGRYAIASSGDACWISVAPPVGYMVPGETSNLESPATPQVLDLSSSTIAPIEIVETQRTGLSIGPARVDDVVWADDDSDGVLDADEAFVAGVTVTLFASSGAAFASGVTSSDGRFAFTNLPEGDYRLGVSNLPVGWVASGVLGMTASFSVTADSPPNLAVGLRPASKVVPASDDQASGGAPGTGPEQRRLLPRPDADQLAATPADGSMAAALAVVLLAALMGMSVVAGSVRPGRGTTITRRLQTSQ